MNGDDEPPSKKPRLGDITGETGVFVAVSPTRSPIPIRSSNQTAKDMGLTSTPPSESLAVYVEENLKPIPEELERTPEAEHGVSTLFPQAPLIERHIEEAVHLTNIGGSTPVASSRADDATPVAGGTPVAGKDNIIDTDDENEPEVESIDADNTNDGGVFVSEGCRSVDCYQRLDSIQEGSYGVVYRAKDVQTGEIFALKKIKMQKESEGFPITALREIYSLMTYPHPNIVAVKEMVVGRSLNDVYMVMEFVDHDLKDLMQSMKQPFSIAEVKCLMHQLLAGMAHLHDHWIIHRDLKSSNLLYSARGVLKIADFGLARHYGSPLQPYTSLVVTLWYRAPELLLGATHYAGNVDMWSVGCLFAEFLRRTPLFVEARSEIDLLDRMFKLLGTANETIWPGLKDLKNANAFSFYVQPYNNLREKFPEISEKSFDLLNNLLTYDPEKRLTANQALHHPYFDESPRAKPTSMMPTWPSKY